MKYPDVRQGISDDRLARSADGGDRREAGRRRRAHPRPLGTPDAVRDPPGRAGAAGREPARRCGCTCRTGPTGTATSPAGSPSAPPTCCSSSVRWPPGADRIRIRRTSITHPDSRKATAMDAVTHPPMPVNEPVLDYAPGSAERAALVDGARPRSPSPSSSARSSAGSQQAPVRQAVRGRRALRPPPDPGDLGELHPGRRHRRPSRPRWPRPPAGARWTSTPGPRSCCARPTCWPGRGGPGSTPRPCSARRRPRTRPRSTRPASSPTSGGSTCTSPGRSWPSSRSPTPRASGTAPITGRWRASSTPSPRSTSPPSPGTCRPRRR